MFVAKDFIGASFKSLITICASSHISQLAVVYPNTSRINLRLASSKSAKPLKMRAKTL